MAHHLIHKQQVFLDIPKKEEAFNYQNRISLLFRDELAIRLDTLFNNITAPNEVIRLDNLRLHLGTINEQNFEHEFKERFIKEMEREVSKAKNEVTHHDVSAPLTTQGSLREALIYFLQFGTLPWYATINKTDEWEAEMLADFSITDWQYIATWVQRNYIENQVNFQRLVFQFSDRFIHEIIANANPQPAELMLPIFNDVKYLHIELLHEQPLNARYKTWQLIAENILFKNEKLPLSFIIIAQLLYKLSAEQLENIAFKIVDINEKIETKSIRTVLNKMASSIEKHAGKGKVPTVLSEALSDLLAGENIFERGKSPIKIERSKAKTITPEDVFYVFNSGIVILHPSLEPYFTELDLMLNKQFLNKTLHARAVLLLHYIATGNEEVDEFDLALQKIICGFPLEETLPAQIELSAKEKDETAKLLQSVTDYWPPLKNTSAEGLQSSFLQREGKLSVTDNGWKLIVEQKTIDILLGKLPWGFSTIRLPWMKEMISVEWC